MLSGYLDNTGNDVWAEGTDYGTCVNPNKDVRTLTPEELLENKEKCAGKPTESRNKPLNIEQLQVIVFNLKKNITIYQQKSEKTLKTLP